MQISEKLKELRKQHGLRQIDIARQLNIERSTYSYYETGKTTPTIEALIKLAEIFGISTDELLHDNGQLIVAEPQAMYQGFDEKKFSSDELKLINDMRKLDSESADKIRDMINFYLNKND